jgi:hypothetical protein
LEQGLTKVCCANRDDWDERVPSILWITSTTTKKLHKYTPFQLVYGREAVVPTEFITPILYIAQVTQMKDDESITKRVVELMELEESRFLLYFHQTMEKARQKDWNDRHINNKNFAQGDQVMLYDSKYQNHPGNYRCIGLDPS